MAITTGIAWLNHILDLAAAIDENTVTPHFRREPLPGDHVLGELDIEHKKLRGTAIRFFELANAEIQKHAQEHPAIVHDQPSCEKCFSVVGWLQLQAIRVNEIFWTSFWYDRKSLPNPTICIRDDWKVVSNETCQQTAQMAPMPYVSGERGH